MNDSIYIISQRDKIMKIENRLVLWLKLGGHKRIGMTIKQQHEGELW